MDFKYIVVRVGFIRKGSTNPDFFFKMPFIFPKSMTHSTMADAAMSAIKKDQEAVGNRCTMDVSSAGFVRLDSLGGPTCYGTSSTLLIGVDPDDEYLLRTYTYTSGIEG